MYWTPCSEPMSSTRSWQTSDTGHDFSRYNYLGEWHSHPRFGLYPSADDVSAKNTVMEIVRRETAN
jgi:proteasome lid subunit RPN8/RPN11